MVKIVDIHRMYIRSVRTLLTYNVTVSEAGWRGEGTHGQAAACLCSLCATQSGLHNQQNKTLFFFLFFLQKKEEKRKKKICANSKTALSASLTTRNKVSLQVLHLTRKVVHESLPESHTLRSLAFAYHRLHTQTQKHTGIHITKTLSHTRTEAGCSRFPSSCSLLVPEHENTFPQHFTLIQTRTLPSQNGRGERS